MIIDINKKILNYVSYLQDKYDSAVVKQSLQMSIDLYNNRQNDFYSILMKMFEYCNLYDLNYNSLDDSKIKQLVHLMKKKCLIATTKRWAIRTLMIYENIT